MTPRNFVHLAAAAAVSVLVAIVSFAANNQWSTGQPEGEKLMPGLADSIRSVARIDIRQGDDTVVVEKAGGSWKVENRGGYPVDVRKVGTLLVALGEAELIERKTAKAERYAALELDDPAKKDATSRLVRLTDAEGKTLHEVVIGKKRHAGYASGKPGGTYVRRLDAPQTWLANVELDASLAVKDWVKTSVLSLDAAKIDRISIEIPGEEALTAERPAPAPKPAAASKDAKTDTKNAKTDAKVVGADAFHAKAEASEVETREKAPPAKLAFVGFPADGKKLKDAAAAEAIARAAASIDLEDVRKLEAAPSGDSVSVVELESAGGAATTLRLRKEGDSYWLSVTATGSEGDAKKAAGEITARTEGWEFKVPAWKANAILKKRADLIEKSES